jgi:YidC/Oxa1 family membrane protein insertase
MNAMFRGVQDVLGIVFGPLMGVIYQLVRNYGLAIIIFTIICRLIQLPFSVKQQRNMAKNARMQMKLRKITAKYKDDKRRQQEETQKFYGREGYNPMKAGCSGGMLIQMPIMIGLFAAINRVLRYTVQVPQEYINRLAEAAEEVFADSGGLMNITANVPQIELRITENIEAFVHMFGSGDGYIPMYWLERIREFAEGFTMFGLQLGRTPSEAGVWYYYLVPVLAGMATLLTSLFQFFRQRESNPQMQGQNPMMIGCMTLGMPLMSGVWALWFPVGVGLFWVASGLIAFIQTVALHYIMPPPKMLARVLVDETVTRRSRENSKKKVTEL